MNVIKVICENDGSELQVKMGTTLMEVLGMLSLNNPQPFLAAYVNNRLKELDYQIYKPISVRYIDITHYEGIKVYHRTLFFTLDKAVSDLYPGRRFRIRNSVSKGFYCEIEGHDDLSQKEVDAIRERMRELVAQDIPIVRSKVLSAEAEQLYARRRFEDKITLLKTRPRLYVTIYTLADMVGYFYGALAPSTGYIHLFDVKRYYNGLYLAVPKRFKPDELERMVPQDKMFDIFKEYKQWGEVMEVSNIGSLNAKILSGDSSDLIKVAEAFHEKKLANIADAIYDANVGRGARLVLVSGPSSSGKTTFAKRLGIQLRILGLKPVMISLDDYFVDREHTPKDEHGEYDYEALEAIDVATFNDHLQRLMAGESVDIPRYDFITGKRQWHESPLHLDERSVLVIEGIHGLNPNLTPGLDENIKFKIYISALTSISMDDLTRIATTDNRLLRRITRDYNTRGSNATDTLRRWESVRRGEDKHIFPYQENADAMFNSSLFYEISVLRPFVEPMLREVPDTVPEYGEAQRLLKFLDNFVPVKPDEIPPTSLLREFIGGSSFRY
ncbi:MAG: nucleoside kinase [Rikenellaceae bacterium]|nr:nucleoside kinase [Rikenellaceae bacterium]